MGSPFHHRYNRAPRQSVSFLKDGKPQPGRTKQSFKEECDVNLIVAKAQKTGVLPMKGNPLYGDFSEVPEYQEALETVRVAGDQFRGLPAHMRERFENDPAQFLRFVSDPSNAGEMAKLGLMKPEAVERVKAAKVKKNSTPHKGGSDEGTSSST